LDPKAKEEKGKVRHASVGKTKREAVFLTKEIR